MTTRIILPILSPAMMTYLDALPNQGLGLVLGGLKAPLSYLAGAKHAASGVSYDSAADLTTAVPTLDSTITTVAYNPEHRPQTPAAEQANLVATVQAASAAVKATKRRFLLVPDISFDNLYVGAMAPFADIVILQGQRLQKTPDTFKATLEPLITAVRGANPHAQVVVQVGVDADTAANAHAALQALTLPIDGVSIWASATTLDAVAALVVLLG